MMCVLVVRVGSVMWVAVCTMLKDAQGCSVVCVWLIFMMGNLCSW